MKRIENLFKQKPQGILSIYCTAGYPEQDSTLKVMKALQDNGADMIELGIPYSDPLADGPVIQESNSIALKNKMSISILFKQLKDLRPQITIPVVLMVYISPILRYRFDRFCKHAAECGVDGLIIPDMPEEIYKTDFQPAVTANGLDHIFMLAPGTSESRARIFDQLSSGFIYAVSTSSITGANKTIAVDYLQRLQSWKLKNPVLVGFGIKDHHDYNMACKYASGVIIGTAYIKALKEGKDIDKITRSFIKSIVQDK